MVKKVFYSQSKTAVIARGNLYGLQALHSVRDRALQFIGSELIRKLLTEQVDEAIKWMDLAQSAIAGAKEAKEVKEKK